LIVLDTSRLLSAIDSSRREHIAAARSLRIGGPLLLTPFVLAELDYLLQLLTYCCHSHLSC
jgi:hypothetical protein